MEKIITAKTNADIAFIRILVGCLLLGLGYYAGGMLGLQGQSAQEGVSPIWPASGIAFATLLLFGIRYWPGIIIGMFLLAVTTEIPMTAAMIAGVGSVLEAVIPVVLLHKLGFRRNFPHIQDVLLFIAIAGFIGPVFSATMGAMGFALIMGGDQVSLSHVWLYWWLGNSLGIIIFGAFILSWWECRNVRFLRLDLVVLMLLTIAIMVWNSSSIEYVASTLMILFLFIPVIIITAIRHGVNGVTLMGAVAILTYILLGTFYVDALFHNDRVDLVFINIAYISSSTAVGMIVASAYHELHGRDSLLYRASHDSLTGLLNRGEFEFRLQRALVYADMQKLSHCLLFINLDGTKQVNDNSGHIAGDALIKWIASVLLSNVRSADSVARIGGDEFAILLWNCPLTRASEVAELIRHQMSKSFNWEGSGYPVTISIGIVRVDESTKDFTSAWISADKACYQAKYDGGNGISVGA